MSDYNTPTTATAYATVLTNLKDRDVDAITLCLSNPSNAVVGTMKWNRASNKFQEWNGAAFVDAVLSIAGGGTGAATASTARTALGLGTMAVQDSNAIAVTGGALSGVGLNATDLTSGLVDQARLGSGAAGVGSKFLADNQTWGSPVPIGSGNLWFAAAPPSGYLICDGSSLLRAGTYAALFAILGTVWGTVDGTHFNIPDLRQKFPLGKAASGTGNALAATGGAIDHTHTYTDVPNHHHQLGLPTNSVADPGSGRDQYFEGSVHGGTDFNNTTDNIGGVATGTTAANNPPFVVINYIIKYL